MIPDKQLFDVVLVIDVIPHTLATAHEGNLSMRPYISPGTQFSLTQIKTPAQVNGFVTSQKDKNSSSITSFIAAIAVHYTAETST